MQEDAVNEGELLAAWAAGSRSAGAELFERHFGLVCRFFRTKVNAELDDLVQQTFLGCVEARERFRGDSSFKTFLLAIARNQLFKHYRRLRDDVDFTVSSVSDIGTSPSGTVARRQSEVLVAEALRRVPLEAQIILELMYWEELPVSDIAQILDLNINTVYSHLHRAKQSLRKRLRELAPDGRAFKRALHAVDTLGDPTSAQ